jgi:hypothetical protein
MHTPVSVADLWKIFEWAKGKKAEDKRAICDWLDSVYADLENLSESWLKISRMQYSSSGGKEVVQVIHGEDGYFLLDGQSKYAGRLPAARIR